MAVSFRQAGKLIEYTANGNVAYHAPVTIGSLIGIARKSAVSGEKISCDVEGVFQFIKESGALTAGTPVTITVATATAAATTAGAISNGVVWADAASDDTVVDVKINQFIPVGTITAADLTSYSTTAQADAKYVSAVEAGSAAGKIKVTKNSVATEFSVPE